jgi:hypothetical protein
VPAWDKNERTDGTFSRSDFIFDAVSNTYSCPGGKFLQQCHRVHATQDRRHEDNTRIYRAEQADCAERALKARCCPGQPHRKMPRIVHEAARDAVRDLAGTPEYLQSRRQRKKVEMLFAHLKRMLKLNRLRLRSPSGAKDEFLLPAIALSLRKLAKLLELQSAGAIAESIN